jgi:two-component system phosphate regulon sensor histidine kinase PhoR
MRLQWKILAGYLLVAGIGLGTAGWLALTTLEEKDLEGMRAGLRGQAILAAQIFATPLAAGSVDIRQIDGLADRLGEAVHARVTVIAADGTVLGDSYESADSLRRMDNHLSRPEVRDAADTGVGVSIRHSDTVGIRMLNLALPIQDQDGARRLLGFVRLSVPLTDIEAHHRTLRNALAAALGGAFLLSLALSYLVAKSITRPLGEIVAAADRLAHGEFHPRIRARSNDEIADLSRVLNQMAASLEENVGALREDRAKMAATLTAMQEGVMMIGADGTILLTNPMLARMLGREERNIIGRTYVEVVRHPHLNDFITQALSQGEVPATEISLGHGGERIFQVRASALVENNRASGLVLVFHDITDLRRLEQVRKDFVANVSHELRTPLTAIKGYVEALRDDPKFDLKQRHRFLEIIETHTDRLNLIITDLLLLSKIEAGQIPLKLEPLEIGRLLDRILGLLGGQLEHKHHTLVMDISAALPPILGDEERLGQVFSNLVDNAIKYTPEHGTITITATPQLSMMAVIIEDNGIGIPPRDLPRIFERFYRVDKARSRELGGTGLGLAIVKHLVEAHGGRVSAESSGKGSRFIVRLPIAKDPITSG